MNQGIPYGRRRRRRGRFIVPTADLSAPRDDHVHLLNPIIAPKGGTIVPDCYPTLDAMMTFDDQMWEGEDRLQPLVL